MPPNVVVRVEREVGSMISANVVPRDVIVVVARTLPDVMVRVASAVGTPTTTYVVVMPGASNPPAIVDAVVLVKPTDPMNVVRLVESTGGGVGTTTSTTVKVLSPIPKTPPVSRTTVLVSATLPLVMVEVDGGLQKGSTLSKQLSTLDVIVELTTPLAKQLPAMVSPK